MTHSMLLAGSLMLVFLSTWFFAQERSPTTAHHHLVLEMTSGDPEQWEVALNNAENVRSALGIRQVQIEVVVHGKGLSMLLKETPLRVGIQDLAGKDVVFAACENTMQRQGKTKADLLAEAVAVDSGVAEIVRKQESGWAYVKAGH